MPPLTPEHAKLLGYAVYGGIAGLIGAMAKSRRLTLPRIVTYRERDGEVVKMIDVGFLAAPFLGALLAAYFDTKPENAIAWGLASGYAGPSVCNAILDELLKRFGINVGGLPEPQNGVQS